MKKVKVPSVNEVDDLFKRRGKIKISKELFEDSYSCAKIYPLVFSRFYPFRIDDRRLEMGCVEYTGFSPEFEVIEETRTAIEYGVSIKVSQSFPFISEIEITKIS
jgi:hypothetical protein